MTPEDLSCLWAENGVEKADAYSETEYELMRSWFMIGAEAGAEHGSKETREACARRLEGIADVVSSHSILRNAAADLRAQGRKETE